MTYDLAPLTDDKSIELESRIARLETRVKHLEEELAVRARREMALQAQLDHLWARVKNGF